MNYQKKRELLIQVAPHYRESSQKQKSIMINEFVVATDYCRKYAIRLLRSEHVLPTRQRHSRKRVYGVAVQEALAVAWGASNYMCGKRLVPFLRELVPTLEQEGRLVLSDDVRRQLLTLSPATADRILRPYRRKDSAGGMPATNKNADRRGNLAHKVFQIADELLSIPKRILKEEHINGRFYFEIWNEEFVEEVQIVRDKLSVGQGIEEELSILAEAYGLAPHDIEGHVINGAPLALRQSVLRYNPDGIDHIRFPSKMKPVLVIEILSQSVNPNEVRDLVTGHWKDVGPIVFETTRRARWRRMDNLNLVRTWTVMCLWALPEFTAGEAISGWDDRYSEKGLNYEADAERQFVGDRKKLIERLPLTDKRV